MAKILVVDDDPTILELFRFLFDDAGYTVTLAKTGRQALDALEVSIPDFMVLDIEMPEMSGRELMAEIRLRAEQDPRLVNIPFVVMTGKNFTNIELNTVFTSAPGFICFYPKMTPPDRVVEKVIEVIQSRK